MTSKKHTRILHPLIEEVTWVPAERPARAPSRKQEVELEDGTTMVPLRMRPVRRDPDAKKPNKYCGPAAISSVTGMNTDEAARLLSHVTGRKRITGASVVEMQKAFALCGIKLERVDLTQARKWLRANWPEQQHLTMAAWLMYTAAHRRQDDIYLISAAVHWQLVECNQFVCGITRDLVNLKDKRVKRRARVKGIWLIRSDLLTNQVVIPKEARPA